MSTLALVVVAAAVCGTVHVMPPGPAPERVPGAVFVPRDEDGKLLRDSFDAPGLATSRNFALRWGALADISEGTALGLLSDLERPWEVEVESLDHPAPVGTDAYRFNVYVGDTGPNVPDTYDVNYFSYDEEGWPMIVLHPANLDEPDGAAVTIAHELYHAIQAATGNYAWYDDDSPQSWYWEASATWAAGEVFPESSSQAGLLFGYAFAPHLSVDHFEYAGNGGGIETLHQYGAFIFLRYLTEHVADARLIRDSWLDSTPEAVPTEVLDDLLRDRDASLGLDDVFPAFAAANATWDYDLGYLYEAWLDALAEWYREDDARRAGLVEAGGTSGWVDAPSDTAPAALAYNLVDAPRLEPGRWVIGVERADAGTAGTDSRLQAVLVRQRGEAREYATLAMNDGVAEVVVEVIEGEELHLVAAMPSTDGPGAERFPWSYRIEPAPDASGLPTDPPVTGSGCSCDSAGGGAQGGWAVLLLGIALRGRRRR